MKKRQSFNGASNGWQNKLQAVEQFGVCGAPSYFPPLLQLQRGIAAVNEVCVYVGGGGWRRDGRVQIIFLGSWL